MSRSSFSVVIARDPDTGEVIAHGGNLFASDVLQRSGGFLPVPESGQFRHRLPRGLTDTGEQRQCASRAAAALRDIGYQITLDPELDTPVPAPNGPEPLGNAIHALTERLYHTGHARQASELLTEFVAPVDGILPALVRALREMAFWCHELEATDRDAAAHVRQLARDIAIGVRHVSRLRAELADCDAVHPHRGQRPEPGAIATVEPQAAPRSDSPGPPATPPQATGITPLPPAAPRPFGDARRR